MPVQLSPAPTTLPDEVRIERQEDGFSFAYGMITVFGLCGLHFVWFFSIPQDGSIPHFDLRWLVIFLPLIILPLPSVIRRRFLILDLKNEQLGFGTLWLFFMLKSDFRPLTEYWRVSVQKRMSFSLVYLHPRYGLPQLIQMAQDEYAAHRLAREISALTGLPFEDDTRPGLAFGVAGKNTLGHIQRYAPQSHNFSLLPLVLFVAIISPVIAGAVQLFRTASPYACLFTYLGVVASYFIPAIVEFFLKQKHDAAKV